MSNFLPRHVSNALPILLIFIFSIISIQALNQFVFSQENSDPSMIMSHTENSENSDESITSYYDALIKVPLLVAQCTIVGIVFNQLVFSRIFYNHILMNFSGHGDATQTNLGTEKRVSLAIILCVVALSVSCTGFMMLQVYNLSSELGLGFSDTLTIVMNTSLYTVWLLRIITAILILILSIMYYILSRRNPITKRINGNGIGKIKNIVLCII
ncbi:MAG: hypothetical protein ACRD4W_12140, partial [Nitrososphaeraceae archaeon]